MYEAQQHKIATSLIGDLDFSYLTKGHLYGAPSEKQTYYSIVMMCGMNILALHLGVSLTNS